MIFISQHKGGNKMKFKYLVTCATCALLLAGCGGGGKPSPKTIDVTGVTLNETSKELDIGDSFQLVATVAPEDATNKNVTWSASGDGIVSVDDGLVTALKAGESTVTVTTESGNKTASCVFTVKEALVPEDIKFSGEGDKAPDTWVYWNDQNWCGSTVSVSEHTKLGNKVTFTYTVDAGQCDWGFQVFYKNSQLNEGASYRLTAKVNSKVAVGDGLLKINGTYVTLAAGDNDIAVKYVEGGAAASSFQFVANTTIAASNTFVISDWAWEGILDIPGGVEVDVDKGTISFVPVDGAASYLVKYYDESKAYLDSESVAATGASLTKLASLADGNYYLSVTAVSSLDAKYDSIESSLVLFKVGGGTIVPAGGPKTNIAFGEEANLPLDKFVYWAGRWDWNVGGQVNIAEGDAYTEEGLLHIHYTAEGSCAFGLQIFYKNSELKVGTTYTVSFKMKVAVAGDYGFLAADSLKTIPADTWTEVSYEYGEASGAASLKVLAATTIANDNTIEMKDFAWVAKA